MKDKPLVVVYRSEFPERCRLAISHWYGEQGPASRKTILTWMQGIVDSTLEQLDAEMRADIEGGEL